MGPRTWVSLQMAISELREWGQWGPENPGLLRVPVSGFQFYLWKIRWPIP